MVIIGNGLVLVISGSNDSFIQHYIMANRSFEELNVYKKAVEVRKLVFELTKQFPSDEKFRLADQIIRSTRKCPANIAEGHGRFHYQENIQFNRIARGSLMETIDHLCVALECNYITESKYQELKEAVTDNIKLINGYIKYLQAQKKESN